MSDRAALARAARLASLGIVLVLAASPKGLGAQSREAVRLDSILVSVLSASRTLDKVPFSASVLTQSDIGAGDSGLFLQDALLGLSGVRIQNRYNASVGERISIRGFGARSQFGVRGIRIFVDGIPATLPDGQSTIDQLDLGSLGRVEALRGPAAALWGNAAGGVLFFRTEAGASAPIEQRLTAVAGDHGAMRLQATASGAGGPVRYRASAFRSDYGGFRNNAAHPDSNEDPYGASARSGLNLRLNTDAGGGVLSAQFSGVDLDALNPGSLPAELYDEGSNQAWGFNVARKTRKDVRQGAAGLSWRGPLFGQWDQGAALEASLYGISRTLDNPIPTSVIDLSRRAGGGRVALSAGSNSRFQLELGGDAAFQRDDRQNYANQGGERGALTLDQRENVRALAAFGQISAELPAGLSALAALRLDALRFRAEDALVSADNPDDSGERSMSAVNPSFALQMDLGEVSFFASAARSFETPTTTELANQPTRAGGFNPDLAPQEGWSFEVGSRGGLSRSLYFDAAVFQTRLTGQLQPFEVPSAPGRRFYRNSGRSRIQGADASLRARLNRAILLRAAYSYVDARFRDFVRDGVQLQGKRIPGVAPHRFDAAIRGERGPWFGELRLEVRTETPADDENEAFAPAHALLGLRAGGAELPLRGVRATPFAGVSNVLDARYVSSVVVNAFGGRYFEPGPGRSLYAGLSLALAKDGADGRSPRR